jgi:hypothetical protein
MEQFGLKLQQQDYASQNINNSVLACNRVGIAH